MSQPSVSQSLSLESPSKRARFSEHKQFIGPSYIRMQVLSFIVPLGKLQLQFINPDDKDSIARALRSLIEKVHEKAILKGLTMQARKNTKWKMMGGWIPSTCYVFCSFLALMHRSMLLLFRYSG